ncbi:hypothetical protein ACA910_017561 [Epithemia clementina (nom. ined.)]
MLGLIEAAKCLGIEDPLPQRRPFPVEDTFGMSTACAMLMKTLRQGRNTTQIQFEMARKVRSTVSNFIHTTPRGVGISTVGQGERAGFFFSGSPTNSQWFKRFMSGCHRQMGDVWIPDKAVTLEEIHAALEILQVEYTTLSHCHRRLEICLTASLLLLLVGYTAALRGEEIPQIDIGMIQKYWSEGRDYKCKPHVPLALLGRFKQTNGSLKTFVQPLAPVTTSGIRIQEWIGRMIEEYDKVEVKSGPMFRAPGKGSTPKRATVSHLGALFHNIFKRVQLRHPEIIAPEVKVEDEYSVRRSLRRGATTEAQNRKIPVASIESNNHWKKHMWANGLLPLMSMIKQYTNAKASVESIIQFSELM